METSLESQYAILHKDLILLVDDITFKHHFNSTENVNAKFDTLISQLDPIIFAHLNKPTTNTKDIKELNQFLRQLLAVKNLIFDHTLITLPILKSIHQSVNITEFEKQLTPKVEAKDQLSKDYIKLNEEYEENLTKLVDCKARLSTLLSDTYLNLETLPEKRRNLNQINNNSELRLQLKEIKKLKLRTGILSEFLLSLISSLNLNWSQDETLKKIVLYCGNIDGNDTLYELLDEVSSDEEDSESE